MKKIIALALAILMMAAIALPAMAVDNTMNQEEGNQSANTTVNFGTNEGYVVTVPAEITINATTATTVDVVATQVIIPGNKILQVRVASDTTDDKVAFTMVATNGSDPVPYEVALGADEDPIENNAVVLEVESNQKGTGDKAEEVVLGKTATLYFTTDGTTQSGDYTDTLTFTTALVDVDTEVEEPGEGQ